MSVFEGMMCVERVYPSLNLCMCFSPLVVFSIFLQYTRIVLIEAVVVKAML